MACGVGDDAVHGLRQRRGGLQQAVKGVFFRRDLGHIQAQGDLVQGDVVFVVGQGYLRVVAQLHQVRHARLGRRQHHAACHGPGHEAQFGGLLVHEAQAPRRGARAQVQHELHVVFGSEFVQFLGACHFLQHVWAVGRAADGVGESLRLDDEFGKFHLRERASAVGQLHAGAAGVIKPAVLGRLPLAGHAVVRFNRKGLAANAVRGGQAGHEFFAAHGRVQRDWNDAVDALVQPPLHGGRGGQVGGIQRGVGGFAAFWRPLRLQPLGLPGRVAAHHPGVVGDDAQQYRAARKGQPSLQRVHGVSNA